MSSFDVIIVGGGIAGASAALALAKENFQVALIDSQDIYSEFKLDYIENRVSAYSLASIRAFQALGVWDSISLLRVSPYKHMNVWDAVTRAQINFTCNDLLEKTLGFIIEDKVVRHALISECATHANITIFPSYKLRMLRTQADCIEVINEKNETLSGRLLIGADGANSWVREQSRIECKSWDYGHTAIVTTVKTELTHNNIARQIFTEKGPLAFLPLNNDRSSIVWSQPHDNASELMLLPIDKFTEALYKAFEYKLGNIEVLAERKSFPLTMRHAKNYIQPRVVLIGDAAHTLHPLAGQGINLGILDALAIAEVLTEAKNKNHDFTHYSVLRRYERWRRSENLVMLGMVDALKNLFSTQNPLTRYLRASGLSLTNRMKVIKTLLTTYAVGNRDSLPALARFSG